MLRRPHVHQRLRRERRPDATLGATSQFSFGEARFRSPAQHPRDEPRTPRPRTGDRGVVDEEASTSGGVRGE